MERLRVEVSAGELIDKITILEIKSAHIGDPAKLAHVHDELALLDEVRLRAVAPSEALTRLTNQLRAVNARLWSIEDDLRVCERDGEFDARFIELARAVYVNNDERARLKRHINDLLSSRVVEEKAYVSYEPRVVS